MQSALKMFFNFKHVLFCHPEFIEGSLFYDKEQDSSHLFRMTNL